MKLTTISQKIKNACPNLRLGCIESTISIKTENETLWKAIDTKLAALQRTLVTAQISKISTIAASKKGYKALGKDPSRYRLSAEALLRRVVKKKGLYKINNVVDLLNLVSISTGFSIGGYDVDKIEGNIIFGVGEENEPYQAIGRGKLNIQSLPVFRDDISAFGSPTSDSQRTMVTEKTKRFLMLVIDFDKDEELEEAMTLSVELLKKYAKATEIEQQIIGS